jgi:DNA-binding NarL/FixJ family response regulator
MGDSNGIEIARSLRERGCNAKILFLTVHQSLDYVQAALAVGASAYVIKSRMNSDLVPAVRAACSGRLFVSQPLMLSKGEMLDRSGGVTTAKLPAL